MTDMEDREDGPDEWARLQDLTLRQVNLLPGKGCGFAVGVYKEPSWPETAKTWVRRHL